VRRPSRRCGPAALVVTGLAVGLVLTGCSGGATAKEATFSVQPGVQPGAADQPCQLHQTDMPTAAYRGGPQAVSRLELPFLAYYTANGNKPFCDGRPADDTDKAWARVYVDLTGNRAAVARVLGG
jgi:hypothetical protein